MAGEIKDCARILVKDGHSFALVEGTRCHHRDFACPKDMIRHRQGVIITEQHQSERPYGKKIEAYRLNYVDGKRRKRIEAFAKRYVYCRETCRLLYVTNQNTLYEYIGHARKLADDCMDFAPSPDGSVILYASGDTLRLLQTDGESQIIETQGRSVVPLSVSNDGRLLVWSVKKQSGYNIVFCNREDDVSRFDYLHAKTVPKIFSNKSGKELMIFIGRNFRSDASLYSYSAEKGLKHILWLYHLLRVNGFDTIQLGGSATVFDTANLSGLLLHYYSDSEDGLEDDSCSVSIYTREGVCRKIAHYEFNPVFYQKDGHTYMVGRSAYSPGGILYMTELENDVPVRSWYVSFDQQREDVCSILLRSSETPMVIRVSKDREKAILALYHLEVLEQALNHLLGKADTVAKRRIHFHEWTEWLSAQKPLSEILFDAEVDNLIFYVDKKYFCYDRWIEDDRNSIREVIVQSLCGKSTLRFEQISYVSANLSADDGFYFMGRLAEPDFYAFSDEYSARYGDLWYFDANEWKTIKCMENVDLFEQLEPHDWNEPTKL